MLKYDCTVVLLVCRQFQLIIQELRLAVDWGFIESIQDTFADLMPKEATEVRDLMHIKQS